MDSFIQEDNFLQFQEVHSKIITYLNRKNYENAERLYTQFREYYLSEINIGKQLEIRSNLEKSSGIDCEVYHNSDSSFCTLNQSIGSAIGGVFNSIRLRRIN